MLDFEAMWNDPVMVMDPEEIKRTLGGNLTSLDNFCCVRLSHALTRVGAPITRTSDFHDKDGNKYIIRIPTMKAYLESKYGAPTLVTKSSAMGQRGIILFEVRFSDASGHVDLWNGDGCRKKDYWANATKVYLWNLHTLQ